MSVQLFKGVDFKVAEAAFFLDRMGKELVPPRHRPENQLAQTLGGSAGRHGTATWDYHPWQDSFWFYLDAFLMAGRSVPDIIQKCFGADNPKNSKWLKTLPDEERARRLRYQDKLEPLYRAFIALPASNARTVTVHGSGTPPVRVKLTGIFGQEYIGGPRNPIPSSEFRRVDAGDDAATQWWASQSQMMPLDPKRDSFMLEVEQADGTVLSLPLFSECQKYLAEATDLMANARGLNLEIHDCQSLTEPPMI
jgi:hypothetical protein